MEETKVIKPGGKRVSGRTYHSGMAGRPYLLWASWPSSINQRDGLSDRGQGKRQIGGHGVPWVPGVRLSDLRILRMRLAGALPECILAEAPAVRDLNSIWKPCLSGGEGWVQV